MRLQNIVRLGLFAVIAAGSLTVGCSKDSNDAPLLSRKGESCRIRSDCEAGLACVNQVCITSEFGVNPNANECQIIECTQPQDCCPELSSSCQSYQEQCQGGDQYACQSYDQYCKCDPNTLTCDNGKCGINLTCSQNKPCPTYLQCDTGAGRCVECLDASSCPSSMNCIGNRCVDKCNLDSDCPFFNRCQNQQCVDSGCLNDRECQAATKNALAFCIDGACRAPCQTNLECGDPEKAYDFEACIDGQCTYVGCESDKECELYLGKQGDGKHVQIVCRPQ